MMKKIFIAALAASMLLLAGCANNGETTPGESKNVAPLEASIAIDNLDSADFPASFDASSLQEADGAFSLELEVYDQEFFDAVDITTLAQGDKITAGGQEYTVETVEKSDTGLISVNGGSEQGGIDFATDDEGGVYYVEGMDDTHTYADLGKATLALADNFTFTDNSDLDDPDLGKATLALADNFTFTDNSDLDDPDKQYDAAGFRALLADDANGYGFSQYNTTVSVEGGVITEIQRSFRP